VKITVLMDNLTNALLVDQPGVARINSPNALLGRLPTAAVSPGSGVPDALIAEPASRRSCGRESRPSADAAVRHGRVSGRDGGGQTYPAGPISTLGSGASGSVSGDRYPTSPLNALETTAPVAPDLVTQR
jgi:hypothetical protein